MGRHKGKDWDHVKVIKQKSNNPEVECKYCLHKFDAGAPRIREHFLHKNPVGGVSKCTAAEEEIAEVVAVMEAIEQQSKKIEQQATKKHQLNGNAAALTAAVAGGRQQTLQECQRGRG